MEVKIGVVYTTRELVDEVDGEGEKVAAAVEAVLRDDDAILWLTDTKGRRVGVPSEKIAYVEIGAEDGQRQVGFGSR